MFATMGQGDGALRARYGFAAFFAAMTLITPAAAQQYGAPMQQQTPPPPSAPDLTGTWTNESQGPDGDTKTTYGFGQDGSFAQAQQSANGAESRFWGSYSANPAAPGALNLSLQITGFLPQTVCVQIPGYPLHCSPQRGPSQMSGTIAFTSADSVNIAGEIFTRDPNPVLLSLQIPQQITLTGAAPVAPNMPQPINPNIPQPVNPNPSSGSNCDDLQQQRLCVVNNGHYAQSNGCLICVPP
jgi:hypothetical protein